MIANATSKLLTERHDYSNGSPKLLSAVGVENSFNFNGSNRGKPLETVGDTPSRRITQLKHGFSPVYRGATRR